MPVCSLRAVPTEGLPTPDVRSQAAAKILEIHYLLLQSTHQTPMDQTLPRLETLHRLILVVDPWRLRSMWQYMLNLDC